MQESRLGVAILMPTQRCTTHGRKTVLRLRSGDICHDGQGTGELTTPGAPLVWTAAKWMAPAVAMA